MRNLCKASVLASLFLFPSQALCAASSTQPNESLLTLHRTADFGDVDAQLKLGKIYLEGTAETPKNIELGTAYLERAAEQNNTEALMCFANYCFAEKMYEEAIYYAKKAHSQNAEGAKPLLAEAIFQIATKIENSKETVIYGTHKDLITYYKKAADLGHAEAQYKAGKHSSGEEKTKYLTMAADQGNLDAARRLINNIKFTPTESGGSIDPNDPGLLRLKEIADKGNAKAQYAYAALNLQTLTSRDSDTLPANPTIMEYLNLAANQKVIKAHIVLSILHSTNPDYLSVDLAYHHISIAETLTYQKNAVKLRYSSYTHPTGRGYEKPNNEELINRRKEIFEKLKEHINQLESGPSDDTSHNPNDFFREIWEKSFRIDDVFKTIKNFIDYSESQQSQDDY